MSRSPWNLISTLSRQVIKEPTMVPWMLLLLLLLTLNQALGQGGTMDVYQIRWINQDKDGKSEECGISPSSWLLTICFAKWLIQANAGRWEQQTTLSKRAMTTTRINGTSSTTR